MDGENDTRGVAYAADIASIRQAQLRIEPYIHRTPVLSSESLNLLSGKKLFFKSECFQKGSVRDSNSTSISSSPCFRSV